VLDRASGFRGGALPISRSRARAGGEPFSLPARFTTSNRGGVPLMKTKPKPKKERETEPIGIVISGGPVRQTEPLIAAYVWGAAPEPPRTARKPHAA